MIRILVSFFGVISLLLCSFAFTERVHAFESSGSSGALSFEVHAGMLSSITGSSSLSNFAVLSGGGTNALGLSSISPFKIFSSIINWLSGIFTVRYEQIHYRWRNDDGSESAATFADAEDTAHANLAKSTTIRLRIQVSNSGWSRSGDSGPQFRLQYSQTATCSSGTYTDVPVTATTEHWQMKLSSNFADGAATTNVSSGLTDGNNTFVAGQIKESGNQTSAISITSEQFTEIEYSIEATTNAVAAANYCFRVTNNGATTNLLYTVYPSVTISAGVSPVSELLHYRWMLDNGDERNAGPDAGADTSLSTAYAGNKRRLRILVSNSGGASASNITYRLEVSSSSCSTWFSVPNSATTEGWGMTTSNYVPNSASTTDSSYLSNPGGKTFTPGYFMTTSNTTGPHSLTTSQFTELEYSLQITSNVTPLTTYCFRLTNAGSTSNFTYTVQPQATILPATYQPTATGGGGSVGETGGTGPTVSGGGSTGGGSSGGEGGGSGGTVGGGGGGGGGGLE